MRLSFQEFIEDLKDVVLIAIKGTVFPLIIMAGYLPISYVADLVFSNQPPASILLHYVFTYVPVALAILVYIYFELKGFFRLVKSRKPSNQVGGQS